MAQRKVQRIHGQEYVYIDQAYWNPEKKRGEHMRSYIGKNVDGVFVPNSTYLLQQEMEKKGSSSKPGPVPTDICLRQFYGATYLLNEISDKTGVAADLGKCFGGTMANEILSIAYFLIIEEGFPLYRFHKWSITHKHPYGEDIPSQRSSELFTSITEEAKMKFFKLQAKRHSSKEYLAFDTTSISTYSVLIKQAKYGKNKEGDPLPQLNLALLYGEESMLPVYYRKLAGNIVDVRTITNLI